MSPPVRTVFIGCVEFSRSMLEAVKGHPAIQLSGIVSKSKSNFNADFVSLLPTANKDGIPCFDYSRDKDETKLLDWIANCEPELILCLGWSHLLPQGILALPRHGVIGYHPAPLPRNRGRHPLIWAVALGLERTASTFFIMDQGADSGDIVSQVDIELDALETAASLYSKITSAAHVQIREILEQLARRSCVSATPQDHSLATYWRKRGAADGRIDWRMSAAAIDRLVRALSKPYVGAEFELQGVPVKVWRTKVVRDVECDEEPGKILRFTSEGPLVKCGEGGIVLIETSGATIDAEVQYL